ncbi:MAG: hypothetical protein HN467_06475 [Opitutae bacterium]|nr:hypothetical protein [Opitutae bacterium]
MIIELKGPLLAMLLAILLAPLVPLIHMVLMQVFRHKQSPFGFLVGGCLVYGLAWLGVDLRLNGFSPDFGLEMIAGFSTVAFFSLGYAEVFSMICRGFSLRILIDIFLNGPFSMDQVVSNYGEGRGVDWMMEKRISGIESIGLVKWEKGNLTIASRRALLLGKFGLWFKQILKLGPGG